MKPKTKKEIYSWFKAIGLSLIIVVICRSFLFTPSVVSGSSMSPNLENNDRLILSKVSKLHRFDELVFKAPDNPKENYVKRVIGLPGDEIEIKNNYLFINGKKYEEPYLKSNRNKESNFMYDFSLEEKFGRQTVPKSSLFVMGDNRKYSNDSRLFGFVKENEVIGKVKVRFYPLNKITWYK